MTNAVHNKLPVASVKDLRRMNRRHTRVKRCVRIILTAPASEACGGWQSEGGCQSRAVRGRHLPLALFYPSFPVSKGCRSPGWHAYSWRRRRKACIRAVSRRRPAQRSVRAHSLALCDAVLAPTDQCFDYQTGQHSDPTK